LAPEIAEGIRTTQIVWEHLSAFPWSWVVARAEPMLGAKIDAENLAEPDGIVEGMAAAEFVFNRADA
jgi:hypothetical protein